MARTDGAGLFAAIARWQARTFTQATPDSVQAHMRREFKELAEHPDDLEEMADILHLLVNLAALTRGGTNGAVALWDALRAKFDKNKARAWQPPDDEGVMEHVR
jgi:hypothetical protein